MDTQSYNWGESCGGATVAAILLSQKRAAANGSQPNCAKSSSRDGNRCLALVPNSMQYDGSHKARFNLHSLVHLVPWEHFDHNFHLGGD